MNLAPVEQRIMDRICRDIATHPDKEAAILDFWDKLLDQKKTDIPASIKDYQHLLSDGLPGNDR